MAVALIERASCRALVNLVDENWRLTFAFDGTDAVLVDYQDYH